MTRAMTRAMTYAAPSAALSSAAPEGTLPLLVIAAARRDGAAPALRHKRAGIWHGWSHADYLARIAAAARALEAAGLRPGGLIATVGENRPELYAALLGAQALGAAAMPLGPDFLDRFGAPAPAPDLVLCETDAAAKAWRDAGGAGRVLALDTLAEGAPGSGEDARAWLAFRAASADPGATALILHTSGAAGTPQPVSLSHARLVKAAQALVARFGLGPRDSAMAFLPMSGIADAAIVLGAAPAAGFAVHCVESPASFAADLREVAPTLLLAPARVFELIDRDISRRLGAGGAATRLLQGAARRGLPGSGLLFSAPLLNSVGLRRCRRAVMVGEAAEPGMVRRLAAYGVPLTAATLATEAGGLAEGTFRPDGEIEAPGAAPDPVVLRAQALLRGHPEIERALVEAGPDGLRARLALDGAALARALEAQGGAQGGAQDGAQGGNGAEALIRRRVEATGAALRQEGFADATFAGFALLPQGFSRAELTLDGEVRRAAAAPRPSSLAAAEAEARPRPAASGEILPGEILMEVRDIQVTFGGVKALSDVSLTVRRGEILSIIGPNGAGKTSLLNVINGIYHPRAGAILFEGAARRRMRPAFAARAGIGRTFQHVSLFSGMNVLDNVLVGRASRFAPSLIAKALRLPAAAREEAREREAAERILAFLDLAHLRKAPVGTLPYGVQKRVELARALATEPRLLLLDEPMAGMTHEEKREMCVFIRAVNAAFGTTILIIEHDIGVVMGLSDRVAVLNYGRKIADGTPDTVRADPDVIAAYLGSAAVGAAAA